MASKSAGSKFHKERTQFHALKLSNPNYFGNLKESVLTPVLTVVGNTEYEQLKCVGYQPQFRRLEAVVAIKQGAGYSGGLCTPGSQEYVRFYLSFDGGASWQDKGMTSFTAHDTGTTEVLEYDVTLVITPPQQPCTTPELPRVRAILAWNDPPPPSSPDHTPVWGDVKEATIQVAPSLLFAIPGLQIDLEASALAKIEAVLASAQKPALDVAHLHAKYHGSVPAHRYLFPMVKQAMAKPLPHDLLAQSSQYLTHLGIDLGKAISSLLALDGDTSFEHLDCVGYNIEAGELVGILTVKQPSGYSGDLCHAGSPEYVSFWRDAGGGVWSFLGTTAVEVHDIAPLPSGGIHYAAFLKWDAADLQQPCTSGLAKAKIRAVLSWSTPATSPTVPPTWGNHIDAEVQIRPGVAVPMGDHPPYIESAGGMSIAHIDSLGIANGTSFNHGFSAFDSPFGGLVTLAGSVANLTFGASASYEYRLEVTDELGNTEQLGGPLTVEVYDPASILPPVPVTVTPTYDTATGYSWYAVQEDLPTRRVVGNVLYYWYTGNKMGRYRIFMQVRNKFTLATWSLATNLHVKLNNSPRVEPSLTITSGGGSCADFKIGDEIVGTYQAFEPYFGSISLDLLPYGAPTHLVSNALFPSPTNSQIKTGGPTRSYTGLPGGVPDGGESGHWLLETSGLPKCGYVVELWMTDRTIWNSTVRGRPTRGLVGLCLRDSGA